MIPPVTQAEKIAGRMRVPHVSLRPRRRLVAASRRSFGDRGRAGDDVEQDVPLRAKAHQHDPAQVDTHPGVDQQQGEEGEQKVRRETGKDLHDGLGVAADPGVHPDPDSDRHPDDRPNHDEDDDAGKGRQTEQEGMGERVQACAVVDVDQQLINPNPIAAVQMAVKR